MADQHLPLRHAYYGVDVLPAAALCDGDYIAQGDARNPHG